VKRPKDEVKFSFNPAVHNLINFSVAQGFTPGKEKVVGFESPINGALRASAVFHSGVNAWARENVTMKTKSPPSIRLLHGLTMKAINPNLCRQEVCMTIELALEPISVIAVL